MSFISGLARGLGQPEAHHHGTWQFQLQVQAGQVIPVAGTTAHRVQVLQVGRLVVAQPDPALGVLLGVDGLQTQVATQRQAQDLGINGQLGVKRGDLLMYRRVVAGLVPVHGLLDQRTTTHQGRNVQPQHTRDARQRHRRDAGDGVARDVTHEGARRIGGQVQAHFVLLDLLVALGIVGAKVQFAEHAAFEGVLAGHAHGLDVVGDVRCADVAGKAWVFVIGHPVERIAHLHAGGAGEILRWHERGDTIAVVGMLKLYVNPSVHAPHSHKAL
jgi:hypothetical protein